MPRACQICNHPERLSIDREIVAGKSKTLIAREFGVSTDSVGHHRENHLSRQLVQAWEKKDLMESTDLLARIDRILSRAEKIFKRNYDRDTCTGDLTALKALSEQRCTIELLAKISAYLHQARVLELENNQEHFQEEQQARTQQAMARLTDNELEVMLYLTKKMAGEDIAETDIPAAFKTITSPPPVPRPPLPKPRPPEPVVEAEPEPDYEVEGPEQEPEPEKSPGLPPAPVREIPGGGKGLKLRRHLLGRRIYEGLKE